MKTNPTEKQGFLHRLTRLPKILILAGLAAVLAVPQAEARPGHGRHGGHHHRHGYHHGGGHHHHHRGHYRPVHRHGHHHVHRGWSRPGWHGSYPPGGYVDYRYINHLPRGYRTVYRGGHRYYYSNGSYWWPATYRGSGVYISVRF